MSNIQASTVSEVVFSIKKTLESSYADITVVGEISNLSLSSAGHYYFNLSDENSSISCALFKMDSLRNPTIKRIKNGDKVLMRGPISLYAKRGTFQIICKKILPYGQGDLKAQFEFLKEKLRSEGLFDQDTKRDIPRLPRRVAVITAQRGAALQDFLNVMRRRSLWYDITIIPSIVQGDSAPKSLINALDKALDIGDFDVVVLTRGGGSMEDLWGFNDENLVRKVYEYPIPVISAIGHQVDYTLVDFVSDLRCETPSSAAEILSQEQTQLKSRLSLSGKELRSHFLEFKTNLSIRLERINPMQFLHQLQSLYGEASLRLERLKFFERGDILQVNSSMQYNDELIERAQKAVYDKINQTGHKVELQGKLLSSLDPSNVLNRGYSYLKTNSGKVLTSKNDFDTINESEIMSIQFKDGEGLVKKA